MYGSQAVTVHDIILALKIQKMDLPFFGKKEQQQMTVHVMIKAVAKTSWHILTSLIGPMRKEWNGSVKQLMQQIWCHGHQQSEFWLRFEVRDPNYGTSQLKMGHAVVVMDHQFPLGHPNISHWSHRCDMKLLGSNGYGAMAISTLSFVSGLWSENRILTHPISKWVMAWSSVMCHKIPLEHPNTNHWSHRCDMKLLGSNRYGAMAISSVSLGSDLKSDN
jgi:hypothetical protein